MITVSNLGTKTVELKRCVLLMDTNPQRRALRKKIMAMHGVEMIGASDLEEAALVWHRDRYDLVLIDIRRDYRGALAFRDEIKKDSPDQIVAFLVGRPNFVALHPSPGSYAPEKYGMEWGESLRNAVRESCGEGDGDQRRGSAGRNRVGEAEHRSRRRPLSGLEVPQGRCLRVRIERCEPPRGVQHHRRVH